MTTVSDDLRRTPLGTTGSDGRPGPTIAHIVTRYLRGGSERRVRDMVRSFPEGEHHLVLGADSDPDLAVRDIGPAAITVIRTLVRQPDPWRDAATLRRLVRLIRAGGYDLVVTHQSKAGVLGRAAARVCSVPAIHSLSMASFGDGYPAWQGLMFRTIESKLARATSGFAVVGADLCRRYTRIGVPADKLHVVRSGVRLPRPDEPIPPREEVCRALGLPGERPLILYLGSLEPRKNVLDLPRYLSRIVSTTAGRSPFLVVAGDGPLADPLRRAFAATGLADDAALLGFVPDPLPLVHAADLVVLLSSAEGVPQALVQAAAAGTPFVAYDVDGVRELIDLAAEGVAVALGDLPAAASATVSLLRRDRAVREISIDLSAWSALSIAEGYRRLIRTALASSSAHAAAGPADGIAIAS